jgi:hypothetical protein
MPEIASAQPIAEQPSTSTLDDQLFRKLDGLPQGESAPTAGSPRAADSVPTPSTDGPTPSTTASDRWLTLQKRMRDAQQRLRQADVGPATRQIQQEILDELRAMLQQTPEPSPRSTTGAESAEESGDPSNRPLPPGPSSSTSTQVPGDVASSSLTGEKLDPRELLERTWGHLPATVREQLRSVGAEQFLPEYSQQIEQYFQSISDFGTFAR